MTAISVCKHANPLRKGGELVCTNCGLVLIDSDFRHRASDINPDWHEYFANRARPKQKLLPHPPFAKDLRGSLQYHERATQYHEHEAAIRRRILQGMNAIPCLTVGCGKSRPGHLNSVSLAEFNVNTPSIMTELDATGQEGVMRHRPHR